MYWRGAGAKGRGHGVAATQEERSSVGVWYRRSQALMGTIDCFETITDPKPLIYKYYINVPNENNTAEFVAKNNAHAHKKLKNIKLIIWGQ